MKIAFYAPLKPPDHPVPSGDRLMARQLIAALEIAGHDVQLVSRYRAYASEAIPLTGIEDELARIEREWRSLGAPDLWFCYHPYYKAPDALGPRVCREFSVPYVTAEASYAGKRDVGPWAGRQSLVVDAVRLARLNISFTERDREGLLKIAGPDTCALLPPFIDTARFEIRKPTEVVDSTVRLIAVAMMRTGDKLESYRFLAHSLALLADDKWELVIVGDGPLRSEVVALFAAFGTRRVRFVGQKRPEEIAGLLALADLYVWPGCGEAFGLAYLEAQAAGLPVVALATAGVPAVVLDGKTGCLTPEGDVAAYAAAVRMLIADEPERLRLAAEARRFAREDRSIAAAAKTLSALLRQFVPRVQ
jgi:glycosyltransferase involved in cell wall biosynthesis